MQSLNMLFVVFLCLLSTANANVRPNRGSLPVNKTATPKPVSFNQDQFSCNTVVAGLSPSDCAYLAKIGFAAQGANPTADNGRLWLGRGGTTTLAFTNNASTAVVLVLWDDGGAAAPPSSTAAFVAATPPAVTWSLAPGASVAVAAAAGVSGGFSGVYPGSRTALSAFGQVGNTWGEFTTGAGATVDVSRLVNMDGRGLAVATSCGCVSDMDTCVYKCINGETICGKCGTYDIFGAGGKNCNIGYVTCPGSSAKAPGGGCQGWADGNLTISFT